MPVPEKSGEAQKLDLCGRHVDPQVRTQPLFHPVGEQPATVIHVHVGEHHVGHGCGIDAGSLQSQGQQPGPRQVWELPPYPSVDEYGPAAATHHDRVQRPQIGRAHV